MSKYILLFIILAFYCLSCSKNKNAVEVYEKRIQADPVVVDIDLSCKNTLLFDSLMELESVVKLETTNDNLIGRISNVLFANNRIVVVDWEVSKSVTVYDSCGKYLNKIGQLGTPEEYVFMWQTSLMDSNYVSIMDMTAQKQKIFDLNGKFTTSLDVPYWSDYHYFLDGKGSVCFCMDGMREASKDLPTLVICNADKKVLFKGFPSETTDRFRVTTLDPLKKMGNKIFFNPPYTDTIFQVEPDRVIPYYFLDIKGKGKVEKSDKENADLFFKKLHSMPAYFNGEFVELDDYAVFYISEPKAPWLRFAIYSKQQKKTYYCNGGYYDARLRFFIGNRFYYQGNMLVASVNASTLLMFKDELYRFCKGEKKEIDELLSGLTEDSNPVLFFYRIKV